MPKVAAAVDVSDDERPTSKRSTITKEPSPPQETSEGELGAQDEEEVDQLEYEIEKILKHRNKMFEGVRRVERTQ